MKRLNITLDEDLKKRVEALAAAEKRSVNAQISVLLEEAVAARASRQVAA